MSSKATLPGYAAPYAAISSTQRGGPLVIVNTVGLLIALFSVGVRVYMAYRDRHRGLGFVVFKDDILCFVSMVCLKAEEEKGVGLTWTQAVVLRRVFACVGWRVKRQWQGH
jgi:hypothetical protein